MLFQRRDQAIDILAGTLADAGCYSFHRGKQVSSFTGGAWVTNDESLAADFAREEDKLRKPSAGERAVMFAKIVALALAVRPWFYSIFHSFLAGFKDTKPHDDFLSFAYTAVQAGAVGSLLNRLEQIVTERNKRAERAREILEDTEAITLPKILPGTRPAYNHCPLMMPDTETRSRALAAALNAGVECTLLNERTVQRAYDLKPDEYGGGPCPRADEFASRVLLIPCHPLSPMARVEQTAEIVRDTAAGG